MSPDCYPPLPISQQLHRGDRPESENQRRRDPHSAPGLFSRARTRRLRAGRCLRALAAWKAPHVQAPRSRLRRFPAMNWASESESPARLRAQCTAPGAGDGRPPNSARTARVRARRPPAQHPRCPRLWSLCRLPESGVGFRAAVRSGHRQDCRISAEVPQRQRVPSSPSPRVVDGCASSVSPANPEARPTRPSLGSPQTGQVPTVVPSS